MRVLESEQVLFVDVDFTLVMHGIEDYPDLPRVSLIDPYDGTVRTLPYHAPHVQLIRERFKRGAVIKVMSAGGYKWAATVVKALGLEGLVDECLSKPVAIIDDMPTEQALGPTMYLKPTSKWKQEPSNGQD